MPARFQRRLKIAVKQPLQLFPLRQMVSLPSPSLKSRHSHSKHQADYQRGYGGGLQRSAVRFPKDKPHHHSPERRIDRGKTKKVCPESGERRRRHVNAEAPQKNMAGRRIDTGPHPFVLHNRHRASFSFFENGIPDHLRNPPSCFLLLNYNGSLRNYAFFGCL